MMLDIVLLFDPETDIEARADAVWQAFVDAEDSTADGTPNWDHAQSFRFGGLGPVHLAHSGLPELEHGGVPEVPYVRLRYPEDQFDDAVLNEDPNTDRDLKDALETVLEMVRIAYHAVDDIAYGFGKTPGMSTQRSKGRLRLPVTATELAADEIEYAVWLMVFPPRMVESYGRTILTSAPAHHVEEFDDGGVLLVAGPDPLGHPKTKPIDEHLGLESPNIEDGAY